MCFHVLNYKYKLKIGDNIKILSYLDAPDKVPQDNIREQKKRKERLQRFEGIIIAIHNSGIASTFTVRKIFYGEGIEKVFFAFSPWIKQIEFKHYVKTCRSKLYFLRDNAPRLKKYIRNINYL